MLCFVPSFGHTDFSENYNVHVPNTDVTPEAVADPGPLMLGVLDTWTPTVNTCILQTLIGQTSLHIELCTIEARDPISLYRSPEQLTFWFQRKKYFYFV